MTTAVPTSSGPSFVAYIDESGCDGFKLQSGSSRWMVVSALVVRSVNDPKVVTTAAAARAAMKLQKLQKVHFHRLKPLQRAALLSQIANGPFRLVSVLIDKSFITAPATFQSQRNRLYFYAIRFLLERVSWLCRDAYHPQKHGGDGTVELVFSLRKNTRYVDLSNYLAKLQSLQTRIDWSVVSPLQMRAIPHAQRAGLLLADAVASATFFAVDPMVSGGCDARYISVLRPAFYQRQGARLRYGLKVWPTPAEGAILTDPGTAWIRTF